MLNHVSIGVADIERSRAFYDAALAPLGYRCLRDIGDGAGYGRDTGVFWLAKSARPVPPNPQSGLHFGFEAPDRSAVDAFHRAAIAAGGQDNGKPGLRPDYGPQYYAAFVIDPDGYRIEACCGT